MTNKQVLPKDVVSKQAANNIALPIKYVPPDNGNGAGGETNLVELPIYTVSDARPDPKPRKHPQLWQAYQWWYTLMELRKAYTLRVSSIERGKSAMDAIFEKEMAQSVGLAYLQEGGASIRQMEKAASGYTALDMLLANTKKNMIVCGQITPVWEWVTSIKGLGEGRRAGGSTHCPD